MRLTIRPAHESEAPLVKATWTGTIDASVHSWRDGNGRKRKQRINGMIREIGGFRCPWMRVGGQAMLVTWAWHDIHRAWVRSLWDGLDVLVAAHPSNDELVGWVASTPPGEHPLTLHYVHTIDLESARRRGVATSLLRAALLTADVRPPRFSFMTEIGRTMVDRLTAVRVAKGGDGATMH